jgi:hypothetical protein
MRFQTEEFIVLASDSRWSARTPLGYKPLHDAGKKLYVIDGGVVGVFAGDVIIGHDSLGLLRRELRRSRRATLQGIETLAQEAFFRIYRKEKRKRGSGCDPVHFLVAMASEAEGVRLDYFGSDTAFKPTCRDAVVVEAYGHEEAGKVFVETLVRGIRRLYDGSGLSFRHTDWGIAVSASLDEAARRVGGTVGGKVQLGILTRGGYQPLRVVALDVVSAPPADDVWREITTDHPLQERPPAN